MFLENYEQELLQSQARIELVLRGRKWFSHQTLDIGILGLLE